MVSIPSTVYPSANKKSRPKMKLSLLILALAVSMATGFNGYPQSKEAMEDYFTDDSMKALVESLFATQQEIGELHRAYSK